MVQVGGARAGDLGAGAGGADSGSAKSNYFRRDFLDALYEAIPEVRKEESAAPQVDMKLAIIGKRNAGKSSLVNALAGEDG